MTALQLIFFAIYLFLGPIVWLFFAYGMFNTRAKMRRMRRPPQPAPDPAPMASILIPSKDGEALIEGCLRSALAQDYPNFEVIAVDDRSTDRTGAIMDKLAAENPRLKVIHIREGELPEGWTGKNNAVNILQKHASGEWLLFVDSDVVLDPEALRATLAAAVGRDYQMVSLLPRVESHSFWEALLIPLAGMSMMIMYQAVRANNDKYKTGFANGQFILIRRDAYDAAGGHAAVSDWYCEDVRLARLVKAKGYRIRFLWGNEFAAVLMYDSLGDILRGWGRIFFAINPGRPLRVITGCLFLLICGYSAYIATIFGASQLATDNSRSGALWLATGAFHIAAMTTVLGISYRWSGNRWINALFFPLAGLFLFRIFWIAIWHSITGKVEWRGTQYTHRPKYTRADPTPS